MCDELDSGFDSFDDVGGSFDDVSVDDLSSTMDDVSVVDDNFDSFEEFEETLELTSDDSIMDVMDDTEVDTNMEAEFFEEDVTQYEDVGDFDSEIIDEDVSVDNVELTEEEPVDVGMEEIELAEEEPGEISETSALDNVTEYMAEHNYGPDDFETYSQDPEWQQLNNELLESDGREPIDYSENTETSAMDNMTEYMYEHNYGRDDFETYSQDPEWQQLNNDLLEEMGREPIDYSENTEASAIDNMTEYMYEHNYGREDFETYSQDPEWQQLNNDLLEEMGREPIDYSETGEVSEEALFEDIPESEQSVADIMDRVEVDDTETLEDVLDDTVNKPDSSVEEWMDDVAVSTPEESFEENEVSVTFPTIEEIENADVPYDIQHNVEFSEALLEERPELAEMFENGEFFEQGNNEHGFEGTCGETTQANTLNKLLGTNEITENDVLNIAIDKNLCKVDILDPANSGGTSTEQFIQLYDEMNHRVGDKLDVELFDYENALGIDDMASKIENGSVLNIAVDSYELWDQPRDITDTAHYTDHWISVIGVDRSADGDITGFKIVDSGGGESYLDVDKFERCYYGAKDNPVLDPTCIVVSRKGK